MANTVDVLSDALKESFKSADLSVFVAFSAALFLLIHGIQGDYARDVDRIIAAAPAARADSPVSGEASGAARPHATTRDSARTDVNVPLLGVSARLLTATEVALVLFWVFSIRAALQVRRACVVGRRLRTMDATTFEALALWPCLTTSSRPAKLFLSATLAASASLGWGMFQIQVQSAVHRGISDFPVNGAADVWFIAAFFALPAAFLAWQFWLWSPTTM